MKKTQFQNNFENLPTVHGYLPLASDSALEYKKMLLHKKVGNAFVKAKVMHVDCALQIMFQKTCSTSFYGADGYPSNSRHHIQMSQSVKWDFENESDRCRKYKVNRCLARYSPRATTTNRPTTGH